MPKAVLIAVAISAAASAVAFSDSSSAPIARELVRVMADKKMEAVAAIDPADQGRFGAALFSSGQLFAVSARYHTPAVLTDQIARKAYRDVYGALNDARVREAKFFVQDLGADGLDSSGASVDVVYEDAVHQTIFDGHPERRRISKREYAEKFRIADERYRHLLQLLLDAAKGDR